MITIEEARRVISAAEQKAQDIGQPMNIAVVDAGRNLKAFARMEDAWLGSITISIDKAFTSASFKMSTQDLVDLTQPGQPLFGLNTTNEGRIVIFAGGIDRKSTRLNSSHANISYAVFCLKKKKKYE